jgi:SAM-dependent methyltransferase
MDRTPLAFDRIADRYDATRGGPERGVRIVEELEPWLLPGRLLEVGVGTGIVALALRDRGYDVTGVDLSPAMLAHAVRRLGPGRLAVGDARRLPVRSASVSTVVFVYALHVVGDIDAALAEAARVLQPGGRVAAVHGGAKDDPTDIFDAVASIAPLRVARIDVAPTVLAAAAAWGLEPVSQGETAPVVVRETPRSFIDGIRQRSWSWLWNVDDAVWAERVDPALVRLEALPDPDRPREYRQRHLLTVLSKPV